MHRGKSAKAKSEKTSAGTAGLDLEQCIADLDKCQNPNNGGDNQMVSGEGLAEVPVAMVDFVEKIVTIPKNDITATDGTPLALPPDMLASFNGHCTNWEGTLICDKLITFIPLIYPLLCCWFLLMLFFHLLRL